MVITVGKYLITKEFASHGECVWNYGRMGDINISEDYDDLQTCISP